VELTFLDVIFIAVMVYLFCVLYVMIPCKCEDFGHSLHDFASVCLDGIPSECLLICRDCRYRCF